MFPSDVPTRHGWVWLAENAAIGGAVATADREVIHDWCSRRLPFVVASGGSAERVRLGLATRDKRRIGFCVAREHVARTAPPLALSEAMAVAPPEWRDLLGTIDARSRQHGLRAHVYGSLAWSYRSNEMYLRPDSDVDLIFASSHASLSATRSFLEELAAHDGIPRLDGELVTTAGAVSWREWARSPHQVLVKTPNGPVMRSRVEFERDFDEYLQ